MTPEFGNAAGSLLERQPADTSQHLAERAAAACEQLARHLARLLGNTGVQLLLKRSIMGASDQVPWLVTATASASLTSGLRDAMQDRDPDAVAEAFVAVLSVFVGLLKRLIREGLVERLLDEVWPGVFTHAAKDTP